MWCAMTNDVIKIDRVRTVGEAVALERLGATMIGVALGPDPRFTDDRTIAVADAAVVAGALHNATLVAALDLSVDPDRILRTAAACQARIVQSTSGMLPPDEVRSALEGAGIGVIYADLEVSHDDDPSWTFTRFSGIPDSNVTAYQIDVLGEYRDSWRFLQEESPAYPDEFQIADLNELAATRDLLVTLDFTPGNIAGILTALPAIRGVALPLSEGAARNDLHHFTFDEAASVLRAMPRLS
jgi:hypothetical protein